jgi:membrane protein YqaA with SNARE-associated domain
LAQDLLGGAALSEPKKICCSGQVSSEFPIGRRILASNLLKSSPRTLATCQEQSADLMPTVRESNHGELSVEKTKGMAFAEKRSNMGKWFYTIIVLESCIFPIPPDPFFILHGLKNPKKIWKLALICTVLSTLGGCIMYGAGFLCYKRFGPFLVMVCGGEEAFLKVEAFMHEWGAWAIIAKGFTPVPYKLMALVSGITRFSLPMFAATSCIARSMRFLTLAFFIHRYQDQANRILDKYRPWIRYMGCALVCIGIIVPIVGYYIAQKTMS